MSPFAPPYRRIFRGFTLIELMITVAILGILVSVALPNYNQYIQRTHRAHAKATLLQVAQWMERAAVATGSYPLQTNDIFKLDKDTNNVADFLEVAGTGKGEKPRYKIEVQSDGTSFQLSAIPSSETGQDQDKCGTLTIDHQNKRGNKAGIDVAECWNK